MIKELNEIMEEIERLRALYSDKLTNDIISKIDTNVMTIKSELESIRQRLVR
jgi:hypothetical protein